MGRIGCGTGMLGLMRVALLSHLGHTFMGRTVYDYDTGLLVLMRVDHSL